MTTLVINGNTFKSSLINLAAHQAETRISENQRNKKPSRWVYRDNDIIILIIVELYSRGIIYDNVVDTKSA